MSGRRTFTIDHAPGADPMVPGELLATARNLYRVLEVREVESRLWPNRFRYGTELVRAHGGRVPAAARTTSTYRKGEGPVEFFGPWPEETP